jgi:hypothetical protein
MIDSGDRQDLLVEAQEKINEAIKSIRAAVRGTNQERGAEAYILGHLKCWANDDTESYSIPNMINDLYEDQDEDEE